MVSVAISPMSKSSCVGVGGEGWGSGELGRTVFDNYSQLES